MKIEHHVNSKEKSGITTGSVSTAASVAALLTITDKSPEVVKIKAPKSELTVEIKECKAINPNQATASVIKPTYNDPDVTRGIEIISEVTEKVTQFVAKPKRSHWLFLFHKKILRHVKIIFCTG